MKALSLETVKARLDGALRDPIWLKTSLLTAKALDLVPSNPKHSMVLWSLAKPSLGEGKPNPALSPALTIHCTHFPFTAPSGRQRESKKISATGEGGLFLPCSAIRLSSYGKIRLPKQVSPLATYSLISWSRLNRRVGCESWFLPHSYISGNFCPSLTSIMGSLWHTALRDLNRLLFFPHAERELCARDSLNCTAQPFINGLNNEQSI